MRAVVQRVLSASVTVEGSAGPAVAGEPVSLTPGTTEVRFRVRRVVPGATTASFTVVDACGEWTSFVGGGPMAF